MGEQRLFQRVRVGMAGEVEINGALHDVALVDISLKGALVSLPPGAVPARGEPCNLMAHLDMSNVTLYFTGVIAHAHDSLAGITFLTIDIDTMIHLRSLLELNSGDPDLVRNELTALAAIH